MRQLTIGLDFRPTLVRPTGVGRYFQGLMTALAELDSYNEYTLFSSSWKDRACFSIEGDNVNVVDRKVPVRLLNKLWHYLERPSLDVLCNKQFDIAHSSTPLILPSRKAKTVVTVCDLYFLEHPDATSGEIRRDYSALIRNHIDRADAILAISTTTADEIGDKLRVPSDRIVTVRAGVDQAFIQPKEPRSSRTPNYFLTVATIQPRKNVVVLLEAVAILKNRGWNGVLNIVGGSGLHSQLADETISKLNLGSVVRMLGYVDSDALPKLYRNARAVVLPSVWEGFGLPLLEAMASETPIIASDIQAHKEVAGDAALYVPTSDPEVMANAMEKLWNDNSLRDALIAKGKNRVPMFSWADSAKKTLDLYQALGA